MQKLEDFITFKTKKCEETLCPYFRTNPNNQKSTTDYTECLDYHNYLDKRRLPYKDIPSRTLAYQAIKGTYTESDSQECNNIIELMYHPEKFKTSFCDGKCKYKECPGYHSEKEKKKWDAILKRPEGSLNNSNNVLSPKENGKIDKISSSNKEKIAKENNKENEGSASYCSKKSQHCEKSETKFKFEEENDLFEVVDFESPPPDTRDSVEIQQAHINETQPALNDNLQATIINEGISKEKLEDDKQEKGLIVLSHQSSEKKTENILDIAFDSEMNNRILDELDLSLPDNQLEEEENNCIPQRPINEPFNKIIPPKERLAKFENNHQVKKDFYVSEIEACTRNQNKNKTNMSPSTSVQEGTNIYYYDEKVPIHEDPQNELKTIKSDDLKMMEEYIEKYVCGFLNSKGGTLYLGITDDGRAVGIKFDRRTMDEICVLFDKKLKKFSPAVRADQYSIKKCPLINRKTGVNHKDYYVVEVRVQQGDLNELYFTDRQQCFIRKQASTIFQTPQAFK